MSEFAIVLFDAVILRLRIEQITRQQFLTFPYTSRATSMFRRMLLVVDQPELQESKLVLFCFS